MKVLFDEVVPGFPIGGADVERLKRQILAMVEGMGYKKMGYKIVDFKDANGRKIAIEFVVASVDKEALHLTRVSGKRLD